MIYDNSNDSIKKEFKKVLVEEGTSQAAIAEMLGINRNNIFQILNKRNLAFKDLYRLLDVIGYDLQIEFIKRDTSPEQTNS